MPHDTPWGKPAMAIVYGDCDELFAEASQNSGPKNCDGGLAELGQAVARYG
jgi:hypothetical protein